MLGDLLYGLRIARRNPGFTAAVVLLVALGAGANATIFTVARSLVFRPLPFKDPDRLISIWREPVQGGTAFGASWPHLADWQLQRHIFEGVAAYIYSSAYASGSSSGAEFGPVAELQVTEGFFPLLGIRPIRGRLFSSGEHLSQIADHAPVPIVVSYDFWRERIGGEPDVVGRFVRIGASTRLVVGVLPQGIRVFRNDKPEIFSPLRPFPGHLSDRSMSYLQILARLQPGIPIEQARRELTTYSGRAAKEYPRTDAGMLWKTVNLHEHWFGSMRPVVAVLLGTTGCVLLIACANLAILLLVRATGRHREIAIRRALGAGAFRITRQLLTESLVLAVAGGTAGLLAATWATDLFTAFSLRLGLGLPPMRLDGEVVGFTLLISLATGMLFGAAPVVHAWRIDLNANLKAGGPASSAGIPSQRAGGALVVAEIALSTVLLIGAGLLLETFLRINNVHPGFRAGQVLTMSIGQTPYTAHFRERDAAFWSQLVERARSLPNVESVALCGALPLAAEQAPENMKARITLEGRQLPPPGFLEAEYQDVSPGYFRAMGIPLKRGRTFEHPAGDATAIMINESFAQERWGAENPVGRRIAMPGGRLHTVIGVVGDVKQYNLRSAGLIRQIYRPLWPSDLATLSKWPSQYLVVRTSEDLPRMAPLLKGIVRSIDPQRPVILARTMQDVAFKSTAWDRLKTSVVGLFGGTALLLTLVGMHAVLAHAVSRRKREIAIRIALGGQPKDIRRIVLRQAIALVLTGLTIGVLVALCLMPLVSDQLFKVSPMDVPTFASVALLLGAIALAASYLPMRSATQVDAITTLRAE